MKWKTAPDESCKRSIIRQKFVFEHWILWLLSFLFTAKHNSHSRKKREKHFMLSSSSWSRWKSQELCLASCTSNVLLRTTHRARRSWCDSINSCGNVDETSSTRSTKRADLSSSLKSWNNGKRITDYFKLELSGSEASNLLSRIELKPPPQA